MLITCHNINRFKSDFGNLKVKLGDVVSFLRSADYEQVLLNNRPLPVYYFEKHAFTHAFVEAVDYEIFQRTTDNQEVHIFGNFVWFKFKHEYVILEIVTGVMISWFKCLGEYNSCTNNRYTLIDLFLFFRRFNKALCNWAYINYQQGGNYGLKTRN